MGGQQPRPGSSTPRLRACPPSPLSPTHAGDVCESSGALDADRLSPTAGLSSFGGFPVCALLRLAPRELEWHGGSRADAGGCHPPVPAGRQAAVAGEVVWWAGGVPVLIEMAAPTGSKIPVTVVTGWLGAGKTTLINAILSGELMLDLLLPRHRYHITAGCLPVHPHAVCQCCRKPWEEDRDH